MAKEMEMSQEKQAESELVCTACGISFPTQAELEQHNQSSHVEMEGHKAKAKA